jgi:hypothetical protein
VPVTVELELLHGNRRYIILVDVVLTLQCFEYRSSVFVAQEAEA